MMMMMMMMLSIHVCMKVKPPGESFNDNVWHQVTVSRVTQRVSWDMTKKFEFSNLCVLIAIYKHKSNIKGNPLEYHHII